MPFVPQILCRAPSQGPSWKGQLPQRGFKNPTQDESSPTVVPQNIGREFFAGTPLQRPSVPKRPQKSKRRGVLQQSLSRKACAESLFAGALLEGPTAPKRVEKSNPRRVLTYGCPQKSWQRVLCRDTFATQLRQRGLKNPTQDESSPTVVPKNLGREFLAGTPLQRPSAPKRAQKSK
jgi:hypothetical protein